MKLKQIITLANEPVRLLFLAMERSLRATGCRLPLKVIPYDDRRFELPENAEWWEEPDFMNWIQRESRVNVHRKYQSLLAENYQFVDSDVIFLENPAERLESLDGFVQSCCHWHNPGHTVTGELVKILRNKTTTWQRSVFNCGQFACDRPVMHLEEMKRFCEDPCHRPIALDFLVDQPGFNLMVLLSDVKLTNLTLPPHNMESTWAGDYHNDDFGRYWKDPMRKPYLLHWAGKKMRREDPISKFFFDFLSSDEIREFEQHQAVSEKRKKSIQGLLNRLRVFKAVCKESMSQ